MRPSLVAPVPHRLLLVWLFVSMIVVGCGVSAEDDPRSIPDQRLPEALRSDATVASTIDPSLEPIRLYFVRDDGLVDVLHRVESPVTALAAIQALGAGPSELEQQTESLRSAIPDVAMIVDAIVTGGTATVELDESFDQIPSTDQILAIGQLVLTLTNLRGVGQVEFLLGDSKVTVPLPEGDTAERPVSADDYRGLLL